MGLNTGHREEIAYDVFIDSESRGKISSANTVGKRKKSRMRLIYASRTSQYYFNLPLVISSLFGTISIALDHIPFITLNNQSFMSIVRILCVCPSISGGSDSTSVMKVSQHPIQVRFYSGNAIPPSLNNFNQRYIKYKGYRNAALNPEEKFVVLSRITSLQSFDQIFIAYFCDRSNRVI